MKRAALSRKANRKSQNLSPFENMAEEEGGVPIHLIILLHCLKYSFTNTGMENVYRKNSKNWDTLNYYRDCPTNGIVGFYSAILRSKDADRITNRVDTDQTAP